MQLRTLPSSPSASDPTPQFAPLLAKCIATRNLKLGTLLHAHFIKSALSFYPFFSNRLIDLYSKSGSPDTAHKLFSHLPAKNTHSYAAIIAALSRAGRFRHARHMLEQMPQRTLVAFNSILHGLINHGFHAESIALFKRAQEECSSCVFMDGFTLVAVSGASACLGAVELLRQVHGTAVAVGVDMNLIVCNALVDAYGKCGKPDTAYDVFSRMPERDAWSWNSMVAAYARAAKLGDARRIFLQMSNKDTISWTGLITGFAQHGQGNEALVLFGQMKEHGVIPNAFTFVGILSACSDLALIEKGMQIHAHIFRSCREDYLSDNVFLFNALVDMYCKCGDMKSAYKLFERMPERDVVSWNSLITGLAQNGQGEEALTVYKNMIDAGVKPNHVTFLGILAACNHTGLVSEGLQFLNLMEKNHGVNPRSEHYAVLIDLLGRKNRFEEAVKLIERAPSVCNPTSMWSSLLSACRVHGNLSLSQRAAEALFELDPENAAIYVTLSKIYAAAGRWDDAHRVWGLMEERGLKKEAGCSWIEVRSIRHEFVARDGSHCQAQEIYKAVHNLDDHIMDMGHLPCSESSVLSENG